MNDFKGALTVSIVGKTNAGKSTLLNALIGEKVSIISPKKQTTRENILGILNKEDYQIVFVDTPGIHKTRNQLGKDMMKSVRSAMSDVDFVLYVVDATRQFDAEEFETLTKKAKEQKLVILLSKIDLASYEKTYPLIDKLSKIEDIVSVIPISSKKNQNLDVLMQFLEKNLIPMKEEDVSFDRETYTDKSVRFMSAEIIREKALYALEEEIPHGIFIEIVTFKQKDTLVKIDADIICKKKSHKPIIIGKGGSKLKEIATKSRADIEKLLGQKILLTLYVKVAHMQGD